MSDETKYVIGSEFDHAGWGTGKSKQEAYQNFIPSMMKIGQMIKEKGLDLNKGKIIGPFCKYNDIEDVYIVEARWADLKEV